MQSSKKSKVPIAYSEFVITSPEGVESQSSVSIWRPQKKSDGSWGCQICLEGLLPPMTIVGEDSLQSLCLAIAFVQRHLRSHLAMSDSRIRPKVGSGDPDDQSSQNFEYLDALFATIYLS